MKLLGAVISSLALVTFAYAQAPKQAKPAKKDAAPKAEKKAAAPKGDKKVAPRENAAAASYNAIPLAERLAIQSDLVWTGDYNGLINGEFSDRAIAAVKAFQKRSGAKETGVLNQPERAALAAAAKPKQDSVGWRMVDDTATGARVGIPTKLMPQPSQVIGGMRWQSSRAEYSAESFLITQPGTTLAATFERMKKEPAGRKTEYSVIRDNFFVISGMQNLKKFYVRAQVRGEEVRGITVLYDQAMAGIMEPVVVAMSSAFTAFPTGAANVPPPRRKVEYASGVAVAPGIIATSREALDGCYVVTIAGLGGADRVAEDKTNGLVLLRVHGAEVAPVALGAAAPRGGEVSLVGVADPQAQGGGGAASVARSRVSDMLVVDAPATGFDGAAALDAQGRLAGVVTIKPAVIAGAGMVAAPATQLTPVDAVRALLDANKIAASGTAAGAEAAKASVVRVICVRR